MFSRRMFITGAATAGMVAGSSVAFGQQVNALDIVRMLADSGQLPDFISPALFGNAPFEQTLAEGTTSLVVGLAEVYFALEDRLAAEQLMALPAALVGDYGRDEMRLVNEGLSDKRNLDLESISGLAGESAGQHIRNATLRAGLSIPYHAIAIQQGRELAESTSQNLRGLGGGLQGLRAAANVVGNRRTISLATAVISTLPQNARLATNVFRAGRQYLQANDLSMPSEEEAAALIADF